jgi:hypothetical protein
MADTVNTDPTKACMCPTPVEDESDPYPTDSELQVIIEWPHTSKYTDLMEYIRSLWWMPDWGWHRDTETDDGKYHVSTGGWSGNEDIIRCMRENYMFWSLCWESTRRGGHYVFDIPESNK